MSNIITIKKFRYSLDWYTVSEFEIDLDEWAYFEMDCRGDISSWYLLFFKKINTDKSCDSCRNYWEQDTHMSFNLDNPVEAALKLGQKLKGFRFTHNHEHGQRQIEELLSKINEARRGK